MTEAGPERGVIPQELLEFLLELAASVNRYATYPPGHPSLASAAAALTVRVQRLLSTRASLSVGVARRQLVVEGVPTDAQHPLLSVLADRLHRQHLGALTVLAGVTERELERLLTLLGSEPERDAVPLGLGDPARLHVSDRVRLYGLRYDRLELLDEGEPGEEGSGGPGNVRVAQLWVGLARAAVARADDTAVPEAEDPEAVAAAINAHAAAPAYDQVIVGYLSQLARELKLDPTSGAVVRRRLSRLVSGLDAATLGRLIEMGGDLGQRRTFLLDAAAALTARSVVDLVQAASQSGGQTISSSMLRLLGKLSSFAEGGGRVAERATQELREQVGELVREWTLDDPNPQGYTQALAGIGRSADVAGGEAGHAPEPLRVVQLALEVDAVGPALFTALAALLGDGQVRALLQLLEHCDPDAPAAAALWHHLETGDVLRRLLTTDPVDFVSLDRILVRLPAETVTSLLLDRIAESASRTTRMGLFQRLAAYGTTVSALVVERLERDHRWFVQRNMLALLVETGAPAGFDALALARHARAPVRREAILLGLASPQRDRALALALADAEERVVRAGVRAALTGGLPESVLPMALGALANAAFSRELRLQLLRALRPVQHPAVRDALLQLVAPTRTLLGRPRLAPATPEMLSALTTLAQAWATDARVQPVLERARTSGDAALAAAAGGGA